MAEMKNWESDKFRTSVIKLKISIQNKAICWLDIELKEKNSIPERDLNPGL